MGPDFWSIRWIPGDDTGIDETVADMSRLKQAAVQDGRLVVFAQDVSRPAGPTEGPNVLAAIMDFIRRRWVFRKDSIGVQIIKTPQRQLAELEAHGTLLGNCVDASVLAAALAEAVGYPTRFVVVQREPESRGFDHIYVEAWTRGRWWPMDGVAMGRPAFFRPPSLRLKAYT